MMDKLLITQDDIKVYRPTATLDDGRINPFILEAQEQDIRPILNPALYLDFLKKFDVPGDDDYSKYNELLIGKEYTVNGAAIYFSGVRPMLVYYALARFVQHNPINITRYGIVAKVGQQSEPVDPAVIRAVVNDLKSCGLTYQNEVTKFLSQNVTTYPLFNSSAGPVRTQKTSFNFFKG